jgi:hypothetical protein
MYPLVAGSSLLATICDESNDDGKYCLIPTVIVPHNS